MQKQQEQEQEQLQQEQLNKLEIRDAIDSCRNEIIRNPEDAILYTKLATLYELDGRQNEAIQAYQTASQKDSKNVESYYRLGLIYYKSGFKDRAIDSLETALDLNLKDERIWNNLGYIHWDKKDWNRARLCYERTLTIKPKDLSAKRNLSILNYLLGEFQKAHKLIEQVLKESEKEEDADRMQLASCLVALGQYEEASKNYEKALAEQPENASLLNSFANCLKELGAVEKASQYYQKSLQLDSENADFNFNYGEFLYEQEELEKAVIFFEKALNHDAENLETLEYLADCLGETDAQRSLKMYQKIAGLESENFRVLKKIVAIQEKNKITTDSLRIRQKIHSLKPNDWDNNYQLAKLYLEQNEISKAWDLLKYHPQLTQKDIDLVANFSQIFQWKKNTTDEIDALELIIKLQKEDASAWFRLAEIAFENQSYIHAYKYILNAKEWLTKEMLFTRKLAIALLEMEESEKAKEISHYLLPSLEIHTALLEPFLKVLFQKNALDDWVEKINPEVEKIGEEAVQNLKGLVEKVKAN